MAEENISYIKHLIQCRCVLPQFLYRNPPIFHSFVAFSIVENGDELQPSFVQCNNCGVVHKVIEVNQSKILGGKEEIKSLLKEEEIKGGISEAIINALSKYALTMDVWQEIRFIVDNELWGKIVILEKENLDSDTTIGKYILILGKELFRVSSFSKEEFIKPND